MFFFRRKPVVVDCFTSDKDVYELARPDLAKKFIPTWWKNLPTTVQTEDPLLQVSTMRLCAGFRDLYSVGFVVPSWTEMKFEVGAQGTDGLRWRVGCVPYGAELVVHPPLQHNNVFDQTKFAHLKISPPWRYKTKEDINWVFAQPTWADPTCLNFHTLPGVINLKHQPTGAVNIFFTRQASNYIVDIKYLQALAHVIPMTDREIILKYHLVNREEFDSIKLLNTHLNGFYLKQSKKCPFHSK